MNRSRTAWNPNTSGTAPSYWMADCCPTAADTFRFPPTICSITGTSSATAPLFDDLARTTSFLLFTTEVMTYTSPRPSIRATCRDSG